MTEQKSRHGTEDTEMEVSLSMYLTRIEAAHYLNVPARWLANNTRRGPRYIKVGGLVRYSVEALDGFMTANERRE
ncbi:hypothetical protein [Arthrobacter sp. R-11]|uniref:hypothetical protein n=1 Tax=Arthrobacter sp. R-11 TaxID=3404053 RepID=UPI003CF7A112